MNRSTPRADHAVEPGSRPGVDPDDRLDGALRAWLAAGPAVLSDRVVQRIRSDIVQARRGRVAGPRWRQVGAVVPTLAIVVMVVALGGAVLTRLPSTGQPFSTLPALLRTSAPAASVGRSSGVPATPVATPVPEVGAETLEGTVGSTAIRYAVEYPHIAGLPDAAVEAAINERLAADAHATVSGFLAELGTPPPGSAAIPVLQGGFTVAFDDDRLLSLRRWVYTYTGGAHGSTTMQPATFDLSSGRLIQLKDLFTPGSAYLSVIADEARAQLRVQLADLVKGGGAPLTWLLEGSAPADRNYGGWAISRAGLEITFAQYQVADFVSGMPSVTIPLRRLASYGAPGGILERLLTEPAVSAAVTLHVFSGRADPSWILSGSDAAPIVEQLGKLWMTGASRPSAPGLGYRGFEVILAGAGEAATTYDAYGGAVTVAGPTGAVMSDPARAMERALLTSGRSSLDPTTIATVTAAMSGP
jgi:hypothetical protein